MAESTLTDVANSIRQQNEDGERRDQTIIERLGELNRGFENYFRAQERARNEERLRRAEERQNQNNTPTGPSARSAFKDAKKEGGFLGTIGALLAMAGGLLVGLVQGVGDSIKFWASNVKKIVGGLLKVLTRPFTLLKTVFNGIADRLANTRAFKFLNRSITNLATAFDDGVKGFNSVARSANGTFRRLNSLEKILHSLGKVFSYPRNLFKAIKDSDKTRRAVGAVSDAMQSIRNFFTSIGQRLKSAVEVTRALGQTVVSSVKAAGAFVRSFMVVPQFIRDLSEPFRKGAQVINQIFGAGDTARKSVSFIQHIKNVFSPIASIFRAFGALGRFLGGPITMVIFGMIDAVMGAIKGFTSTEGGFFVKFIGAITGFFSGATAGLIGGLLDLGKMLVGWIAGLFGFDDFKEKLASFSFREMIFDGLMFPFRAMLSLFDDKEGNMFSDLGQELYDHLIGIWEKIKNWFSDKVTSLGSGVAEFFGFGEEETETPRARPTRGRTAKADQLAEQRAAVEAEKARTAGNVTIMDNSQNNTVSGGGGGGSPSLGTSSATDAHDPATSHI